MLAIPLQEFEEASRGAPRLPLLTAPWESHVPWTAQHPWQPFAGALPSFSLLSLSWGSQLWTHNSQQHGSHALSEHTVTLISHSSYASLLYSFLSPALGITPVHKLMTLSYAAHSKNISINILLLILLCTSVFSICHTVQRKQYNQIPYHVYV